MLTLFHTMDANFSAANSQSVKMLSYNTSFRAGWMLRLCLFLGVIFVARDAQAQWISQSFTLKPGWNAIYTHVNASHQTLDSLLPDANGPVAEIWLWKPTFSTSQFINNPVTNEFANNQWAVWTSARGDTDTLTTLVGNGAYLINNRSSSSFVWTVKGKPVPPDYQWTTTGLNFIGFPTPAATPPNFAAYLAPEPSLDLALSLQNSVKVFRYIGGDLGVSNPAEVVSFTASTTPVSRGEAFWVRGSSTFYNRYYGPVEVTLQNTAGLIYSETLGSYTLRFKNLTTSSRTVSLSLLNSEAPPAGQQQIIEAPQLLLRGELSTTTLTYGYSVLAGNSFTIAPKGQVGSELQIILGLNRSTMTAVPGSLYAGILRILDASGLQQTDLPVSATVANASGLWVGQASINQVGQYLKSYPKVDVSQADQTAQINSAAAQAGKPPHENEMPGAVWSGRETNVSRAYSSVASSLDGRTLAATANGAAIYVSLDYGTTWVARDSNRAWSKITCSGDGSVMAASVFNGAIYLSTNSGTSWTATASGNQAWVGLAASADGNVLAAAAQGGSIYVSTNRGSTWLAQSGAGLRNWSSIASSADGRRFVATVNPGQLYFSMDGGVSWRISGISASWSSVATSSDGLGIIAAVDGGQIYLSTDAGTNWLAKASASNWNSVSSSTDGRRLAATVRSGQIHTSDNAGATWLAREQTRNWDEIISSGDATRLFAGVNGGALYTLNRTFASYTVDPATGLVQDQNGLYLSSGVNTNMARVGNAFPLRLIIHNQAESNHVNLLQRVYIGQGRNITNAVVATRESFLDADQLASARRITATHLPFSIENNHWLTAGAIQPGSVVIFTVVESYKDQASNPFLHTFNPNHDNLDANFKSVLPLGIESYNITRAIRLTFTGVSNDFSSLTASAQSRDGVYEETMTIGAQGGASRDFKFSGSFNLQLISPIATLTQ
ncbi:MAG: WD40/YVTN/BNR-like repeat-containing protein [Verrucomicrobiales bacterium]